MSKKATGVKTTEAPSNEAQPTEAPAKKKAPAKKRAPKVEKPIENNGLKMDWQTER